MAPEMPPSWPAGLGHRLARGCRRLRLPRARWVYVLAAIALLGASEVLWLWHSWPVREILETEKLVAGPTA
jgi:hypothetical protein